MIYGFKHRNSYHEELPQQQTRDVTLWLCQQLAIENDHRNSGFSHLKMGGFSIPNVTVYQRVMYLKQ